MKVLCESWETCGEIEQNQVPLQILVNVFKYPLTDLILTGCRQINLLVLNTALRKKRVNQDKTL